jgi:phosphonate transport system substrate-binding protein
MDYLMRQHIQVTPTFGGSQQGIMMQLMSGNVIAAGVNSTIMREFADQQHLRYRVLWESPPYHDLAISAHARVPKAVIMAVQKAFAGMSEDAEGMKILENSARVIKQTPPYGFLPASQQDYQAYLSFYRHAVFQGAN